MHQSHAVQRPTFFLVVCYGQLTLLMRRALLLPPKRPTNVAKAISRTFEIRRNVRIADYALLPQWTLPFRSPPFSRNGQIVKTVDGTDSRETRIIVGRSMHNSRSSRFFRIARSGALPQRFVNYLRYVFRGRSVAHYSVGHWWRRFLCCVHADTQSDGRYYKRDLIIKNTRTV